MQTLGKSSLIKDNGTLWFRRFVREVQAISPHIRFKRIKYGFYRIYWKMAYVGECYKEMPMRGYDIVEADVRFESKKYFEEYEDNADFTMSLKNFREGYYDSMPKIRARIYQMKNSAEHYTNARNAYKQMRIH